MAELTVVKLYYGNLMMLPDLSRVLACLHEKDVKYSLMNMNKGEYSIPMDFLKLQEKASNRVHGPAFEDGTKTLFESRAICRYVLEKYAERGNRFLLGKDPLERASIEQWLKSEENSFDPPSWTLVFHLAFPPLMDHQPNIALIDESEKKLAEVLDVYEQRLAESKYLAGNEFTLADLSHLPNSHYLANSKEWGYLFSSRKKVSKWWERISKRDSWKKTLAKLDEITGEGKSSSSSPFVGAASSGLVPSRKQDQDSLEKEVGKTSTGIAPLLAPPIEAPRSSESSPDSSTPIKEVPRPAQDTIAKSTGHIIGSTIPKLTPKLEGSRPSESSARFPISTKEIPQTQEPIEKVEDKKTSPPKKEAPKHPKLEAQELAQNGMDRAIGEKQAQPTSLTPNAKPQAPQSPKPSTGQPSPIPKSQPLDQNHVREVISKMAPEPTSPTPTSKSQETQSSKPSYGSPTTPISPKDPQWFQDDMEKVVATALPEPTHPTPTSKPQAPRPSESSSNSPAPKIETLTPTETSVGKVTSKTFSKLELPKPIEPSTGSSAPIEGTGNKTPSKLASESLTSSQTPKSTPIPPNPIQQVSQPSQDPMGKGLYEKTPIDSSTGTTSMSQPTPIQQVSQPSPDPMEKASEKTPTNSSADTTSTSKPTDPPHPSKSSTSSPNPKA